jgi:hypothetical protein
MTDISLFSGDFGPVQRTDGLERARERSAPSADPPDLFSRLLMAISSASDGIPDPIEGESTSELSSRLQGDGSSRTMMRSSRSATNETRVTFGQQEGRVGQAHQVLQPHPGGGTLDARGLLPAPSGISRGTANLPERSGSPQSTKYAVPSDSQAEEPGPSPGVEEAPDAELDTPSAKELRADFTKDQEAAVTQAGKPQLSDVTDGDHSQEVEAQKLGRGSDESGPPPLRHMEGVHPELQKRVDRVVRRMWEEFGHRVEATEGYRSQERQERLYAQGRSTPGPVVTWTRNSAHSRGEAVDVRIDGGWDDQQAFKRLQRVAGQEGLRTLGMRDPGHLELPRNASASNSHMLPQGPGDSHTKVEGELLRQEEFESRRVQAADARTRSARTGQGGVATPAAVARVAAVARPGMAPSSSMVAGTGLPDSEPRLTPDHSGATSGGEKDDGGRERSMPFAKDVERRPSQSWDVLPRPLSPASADSGFSSLGSGFAGEGGDHFRVAPASGLREGVRAGSAEAAFRVEQARALRDGAPPPGHLHVSLLDVDGAGTDLRLGMRGRGVSADVRTANARMARDLQLRIGELRAALQERGLEPERLTARVSQGLADPSNGREASRLDPPPPEQERTSDEGGQGGGMEDRGNSREDPRREDGNGREHFQRRDDDQ